MARTAIPVNKFLANNATALLDPTGTAIDQANGMNVALAPNTIPAGDSAEALVLRVHNSAAGAHVATIGAGVNPPSFRAGIGALAVSIAAGAIRWVGPLEPARFLQADGSVNVDFDTGTTGDITAFVVPAHTN